jgi:hypothetical protein
VYNNLRVEGILKPWNKVLITYLYLTTLCFISKFLPKRFHKIGSRTHPCRSFPVLSWTRTSATGRCGPSRRSPTVTSLERSPRRPTTSFGATRCRVRYCKTPFFGQKRFGHFVFPQILDKFISHYICTSEVDFSSNYRQRSWQDHNYKLYPFVSYNWLDSWFCFVNKYNILDATLIHTVTNFLFLGQMWYLCAMNPGHNYTFRLSYFKL